MKERLGDSHPCGGCGKIGRERLNDNTDLRSTSWACSPTCGTAVLRKGNWGVLAWIKLP